eukprot:CAMPEP_0201283240 /NCGR_PEP_ID=MMETSP1317-20130820/8024_1 /ASSEMBLY_ACC=CAM_ASM_000770 /TAXON_ID=187299 /ORGANISM="Undescribed Undescribed, Strain Undescribed" /LENGTH=90 /DNA_ID=CAMNT_0047598823 /DNA_START=205 /DNA_END=477 /DNA_ORIENTATION=+
MLFCLTYENRLKGFNNQMNDVKLAAKQLSENLNLQRLLFTLLSVGNILNDQGAKGISVTSLALFNEVRGFDKKHNSLLSFVLVELSANDE